MKKYFIKLCWNSNGQPYFHLKDYVSGIDNFTYIPQKINIERNNKKICIGTLNPYTREYINCNNLIMENETQCSKCKYLFDFYKCIKCHGENCQAQNKEVLKYCNTQHYVYLAYFPNEKIKIGTASEVKKYNRLLEQGALFSIFIAKTPTGKIARQIEKDIIDNGVSGAVTTNYKMKNICYTNSLSNIREILIKKNNEITKYISKENKQYLIEPEFNSFEKIKNKINNIMLEKNIQFNLFDEEIKQVKPYEIKKNNEKIIGKYLFSIGKILVIENNGIIEMIDTKKIEGFLFEFKNIKDLKSYDANV